MDQLKYILIFIIALKIFPIYSQDYCDIIQSIQNYQDSVKLKSTKRCDIIDPKTFDLTTYLKFFDKIEVEEGYKIGVCYFDNFADGSPYLYAIKENKELKDNNKKSLYKLFNSKECQAKYHVKPTPSDIGFLQYLFFYKMGEQFALKWHSNYNEEYIICSTKKLSKVVAEFRKYNQSAERDNDEIESPPFIVDVMELNKIEQINPAVEVESFNDYYLIEWIENRTHDGIYKCKYKIQNQAPFDILLVNEELLLKITPGFLY